MKKIGSFLVLALISQSLFGQVSGNINYRGKVSFPVNNINVNLSPDGSIVLSVKGLSNVQADSYVAIFSVTQAGKTTSEVNRLINERIRPVKSALESNKEVSLFVDMISFVPVFEYEKEKKIFSKKTYNEVPKGFELKKSLHIHYRDSDLLNELISLCAASEIYDLVRVDYVCDSLEQKRNEMMEKARILVGEKLKNYQEMLGVELSSFEKNMADGFRVIYPGEQYNSYLAYFSNSLLLNKDADLVHVDKSRTSFYQPIMAKEFDFVFNPIIVEPVIQILYEVKLKIILKKEGVESEDGKKKYLLISPSGDLKELELHN